MKRKIPNQFEYDKKLILFRPNSDNIKEAFERSQNLGVLPNSFTKGMGRMTGFLGEVAFEALYPKADYVGDTSYSHDYVLGKRKIDVKAKTCTGKPLPHYTASVNTKKDKELSATVYFFVRVRRDLTRVWLLGWETSTQIKTKSDYKKKGELDEYGFTYKVSGYHLPIQYLRQPQSL